MNDGLFPGRDIGKLLRLVQTPDQIHEPPSLHSAEGMQQLRARNNRGHHQEDGMSKTRSYRWYR